jgi:hypothetical protein
LVEQRAACEQTVSGLEGMANILLLLPMLKMSNHQVFSVFFLFVYFVLESGCLATQATKRKKGILHEGACF